MQKKSGGTIGVLGDYFNLKAELKYNQVSNFTFDYPAYINQMKTPFYDDLVADRIVKIDPYGVFVLSGPSSTGDGIREVKSCTAYSIEYELSGKSITLEAGTYRFYNLVNPSDTTTLIGRILEKARNWSIGSVSKSLWSRYRTFDDTETKIYDWMMNTIQSTYNCVFVFDTYTRTINVLDADDDVTMIPVYLSYDNMIKECTVSEITDNMFTKLSVYGADPLTIREVNPIGSNYIYNLDYYVGIDDVPSELATKWNEWQTLISSRQQYYTSLIALRNAAYGRYLTANSSLTDMDSDLASLDNLRSVNVQGLASATNQTTIDYYTARLAEVALQYSDKEDEIDAQQELVGGYKAEYDAIGEDIAAVVSELAIDNYFTGEELDILDHYFVEDNFVDSTFAVYDVDVSSDSDSLTNVVTADISFSDITLVDVAMTGIWGCNDCYRHFSYAGTPTECPYCGSTDVYSVQESGRRLFSISGGTITISGTYSKMDTDTGDSVTGAYVMSAAIVNGTLDRKLNGELVCSFYLGSGTVNGTGFPSGNITISSTSSFDPSGFVGDLDEIVESEISTHYEGSSSLSILGGSIYFTRNVTDSQRYYVAQELYDFAVDKLKDIAVPTYSFELSTINPIFAKEFEPFKNALKFGSACYLKLGDELLTKQMLLEIHLDFEDPAKFEMIFSNEFKRPSYTNKMKDQLKKAESTSRTLALKSLSYGDQGGLYNAVSEFIRTGLNTAATQVLAGKNQNITVDGRGIKIATVGGKEYILMADGMIAIIDSDGNANMAMGHFYNDASGQDYYGVLADVIGGTLLIGLELNIICPDQNGGVAQFKVDSSGCFLNNSRFYLQNDGGGKIGLDANYGIFGGTSSLFTVTDTGYVHPSFIDADTGDVVLDDDGMPQNANFWLGINGEAYFRGTVIAEAGKFQGVVQTNHFLRS
ncbi:hypothetical protein SDC9_56162 [bioreactor metagenome]|uniref:Prophage tail endopeptidase domain-containing protein n=1 Tax=bioreactor metagenome TaxID=1076179 RepID=A0A644X175_9ZZZZ